MCTLTVSYDPTNSFALKMIDLMRASGAFSFEIKDDANPYTMDEIMSGIDESERQLTGGLFCTGEELDREVANLIESWH